MLMRIVILLLTAAAPLTLAYGQAKQTPVVPEKGHKFIVYSVFCETQDQIERFIVLRSAGYQHDDAVARVNAEFVSPKPPCEYQWRAVWKPVFLEKSETHSHAVLVYAVSTYAGLRFTLLERQIVKA